LGIYSDVTDPRFSTVGQKFLRGYQVTDPAGKAVFRTIYPGWYAGRTVHMHFKVRTPAKSPRAAEFTSQLYFDDALTDRVHAMPPYAGKGQRTVRNTADGIFRRGGDQLLLTPRARESGYEATFSLGLQLS
jgi:protocatechuate 3,4-dioxygenase beta subunit